MRAAALVQPAARCAALVVVLLAFAFPQTAFSHQSSVVFLRLVPERHTLHVTLRIANSDLFEALGLPADHVVLPKTSTASGNS